MFVAALWPAALSALAALAYAKPPARASLTARQATSNISFVSTQGSQFTVNGSPLGFVGTNAYWLHTLSEEDIDYTLGNISAAGIKVVRTWAFNDVTTVPENGTWFQLIHENGTATINDGPNGLQKLDKVIELARKHDLYVLLAFTNNWNPDPAFDDIEVGAGPVRRSDIVPRNNNGTGKTFPRNFLSNDYGGMDTYLRTLGLKSHDDFYTNEKIIGLFKDYTATIAKRYTNSPSVFAWELANDPRCTSTLPAAACNPQVVTKWHGTLAEHVKTVDPNHLVSSGNGGYLCVGCPKVNQPQPPPPQVSPAAGARRRSTGTYLTKRDIIQDRLAARKLTRSLKRDQTGGGIRIRGRWTSTPTRRQDVADMGPAYDGSFGVDSEDLLNVPDISFGSFQLFPDQATYGPADPSLSGIEAVIAQGSDWIRRHARTSAAFGKPSVLNGFGLVTQPNAPAFVPFNSTEAPFAADAGTPASEQPFGVSNEERDRAFTEWLNVGYAEGLRSMIHYQWGQENVTASPGTPVSSINPGTALTEDDGATGLSPNDGYSTNGAGRAEVVDVLEQGVQQFASDSLLRR
ncbi:beta-mannase [Coprinopsis sp. MPI-PUGE-AT-0042]|nr:beta-mannase [Coprinopsis sp. MPI-PUGE-AT-0042]